MRICTSWTVKKRQQHSVRVSSCQYIRALTFENLHVSRMHLLLLLCLILLLSISIQYIRALTFENLYVSRMQLLLLLCLILLLIIRALAFENLHVSRMYLPNWILLTFFTLVSSSCSRRSASPRPTEEIIIYIGNYYRLWWAPRARAGRPPLGLQRKLLFT